MSLVELVTFLTNSLGAHMSLTFLFIQNFYASISYLAISLSLSLSLSFWSKGWATWWEFSITKPPLNCNEGRILTSGFGIMLKRHYQLNLLWDVYGIGRVDTIIDGMWLNWVNRDKRVSAQWGQAIDLHSIANDEVKSSEWDFKWRWSFSKIVVLAGITGKVNEAIKGEIRKPS